MSRVLVDVALGVLEFAGLLAGAVLVGWNLGALTDWLWRK